MARLVSPGNDEAVRDGVSRFVLGEREQECFLAVGATAGTEEFHFHLVARDRALARLSLDLLIRLAEKPLVLRDLLEPPTLVH